MQASAKVFLVTLLCSTMISNSHRNFGTCIGVGAVDSESDSAEAQIEPLSQQQDKVREEQLRQQRMYQQQLLEHHQKMQQMKLRSMDGSDSRPLVQGFGTQPVVRRTATGGAIYTLMVTLTVFAFVSNGAFLVYVFWLSR